MSNKTIHDCVVEIHRPSGDYPGQVCEGKYCYEDGVVTLVDHNGVPLGKTYSRKLNPDEVPVVIARRMTKQFYHARRGGRDKFTGPIPYKPLPKWM